MKISRWAAGGLTLLAGALLGLIPACADESIREIDSARLPIVTTKSGMDYVAQCRAEGVPVPDRVLDGGWINHGYIEDEFILGSDNAELWSYTQSMGNNRGICLALPRWDSVTDETSLLGVICLGKESSKSCYFDIPLGDPAFPRYTSFPISSFEGGTGLIGYEPCTDCHAGENPFIIHPEKHIDLGGGTAAFADLLGDTTRANLLQPASNWHDPIAPFGWPQNPGPEVRLDKVYSPGDCTRRTSMGSAASSKRRSHDRTRRCRR